jgi:BirA family biotin operon repressor/biotin-[acetyl-CoA-carboxylase] ligase
MTSASAAATLEPGRVEPLLHGRLGRPYLWRGTCDSTQLLLDASMPEGATAVAEEQTSGRGRLGRIWETPPGRAILVSVLLRPPAGRPAAQISIAAGVAVARTVEGALAAAAPGDARPAAAALPPVRIKWPNDVMIDGRKCCGILAEARDGVVVLGIGLNVNQQAGEFPPTPYYPPTSLRLATGLEHDRAPLLAALLGHLEDAYGAWCAGGLEALHGDLAVRDFLAGRAVLVDGAPATALGIEPSGALAVEVAGARRLVGSGEVTVAPAGEGAGAGA